MEGPFLLEKWPCPLPLPSVVYMAIGYLHVDTQHMNIILVLNQEHIIKNGKGRGEGA